MSVDPKIRVLHTTRPVNDDCVEKLEKALADAKAGEIVAVAIAGVGFDGAARTAYSKAENGVTLLGSAHYLCARMQAGLLED